MPNLVEAHGLFWWRSQEVPSGHYAPPLAVSGKLVVTEEGLSELELDGLLTTGDDAHDVIFRPSEQFDDDIFIEGVLKESVSRRVLLGKIKRNGATSSTAGISYERFNARECLVFDRLTEARPDPDSFCEIQVDISNLEDWLRSESIHVTPKGAGYVAELESPEPEVYSLSKITLAIEHSLIPASIWKGRLRRLDVRQVSRFAVRSNDGQQPLQRLREWFQTAEDFLLLLIGSPTSLDWPRLKGVNDSSCRYYFWRASPPGETTRPLHWSDCWTSFQSVKSEIGALFSSFMEKRDELGPGLYLYAGTRRARRLYMENRFMNLVWGLESLHRKLPTEQTTNLKTSLEIKVDRILGEVKLSKGTDRRWLVRTLKGATEPSLSQRLFEVFDSLPLRFNKRLLCAFCDDCAKMRNDVSHFGGERHGNYRAFYERMSVLTDVIQVLYHAVLLTRIGIHEEQLLQWLLSGPHSYGYQQSFDAAGLGRASAQSDEVE